MRVTSSQGARTLQDGRGLIKVSATTAAILNGTEDLSVWSEEELIRGVRRGKNGRFCKAPKVVPKAVHDELIKRRMVKAYDLLKESTYDAVAVLVEIAKDADADAATRVKAAELILDRTLGKAPQHVELDVHADTPFTKLMAGAIVATAEQARELLDDDVIEGEVVAESR